MSSDADELSGSQEFDGQITVAARIIDYLSSGLYKSPAACLKELVNNSYDADATLVRVLVKPDADRIIIEDDGRGMTRQGFEKHFQRISESHKRDDEDLTPSGRPMIGKIGIGFIAANEICEEMEIFSTVKGQPELLHVTVNFMEMRQDSADRRRRDNGDYAKADYHGEILEAPFDEHYTLIFLKHVRGEAKEIMAGASKSGRLDQESTLYGLKPATTAKRLARLNSWSSLDDYSQTMLGVALNVPVRYFDQFAPEEHLEELKYFMERVARLNFRVEYDGTELLKPVVLTGGESGRSLVKVVEFSGQHAGAHAWFYAQHGTLRPENLNGVLIRIRNAAVGEYDDSFLGFPHAQGTLFQRWVTAEIYADDRLEEALNIDRRTLREAHPAYVELRRWFHGELSALLRDQVRNDLYAESARERKEERTKVERERIGNVAKDISDKYGSDTAETMKEAWSPRPPGTKEPRNSQVTRKYSLSEIYERVYAAADETLPPELAKNFIEELTRRLQG